MRPEHACEPDPDWEDPIVAEIHAVRRQIMARFNNDLSAYVAYLNSRDGEYRRLGFRFASLPRVKPERCETGTT
jgi:hypothetical protein